MTYDEFILRAVLAVGAKHPHWSAEQMADEVNRLWSVYELATKRRRQAPECLACGDQGGRDGGRCVACGKGSRP